MIVLDASVLVDILLREPLAAALGEDLLRAGDPLHAPHLIDVEIMHVLRRLDRAGVIDAERAGEAMDDLSALPIRRHPHGPLLAAMWSLRANVSAYDAVYVALAEALDARLVTRDAKLAKAIGARVEVLLV